MDDAQVLHVSERTQQLDSESSDEPVLKSLIVVHLYKLVEVYRVQVKDAAQVVSEDEIVPELDYSLDVVRV